MLSPQLSTKPRTGPEPLQTALSDSPVRPLPTPHTQLTPGARPEAGRPSAWTLLGGAWLLPHSITLSMTVMPLLCISMLARHFSAASVLGVELLTAVLQATTYFKLYIGDTDCFQR